QLIKQSASQVKQQARSAISGQAPAKAPQAAAQDYWFMNQPATPQMSLPQDYATFASQQVVAPGAQDILPAAEESAEEKALAEKILREKQQAESHTNGPMRVVQPLHDKEGKPITRQTDTTAATQNPQPAPHNTTAPPAPQPAANT